MMNGCFISIFIQNKSFKNSEREFKLHDLANLNVTSLTMSQAINQGPPNDKPITLFN